jgi:tryptophanyl-tRNA synthetase
MSVVVLKMADSNSNEVRVDPWEVTGKFTDDVYQRLIKKFGVSPIDTALLERLERVTCHPAHKLLRRGLFFAHRGLNEILDDFEAGKPIFIYTGRGPSGSMHLGHFIPMEFTVWLQKVFNAIVVFQIADDEKFWFKDGDFQKFYELGKQNARDIIALGFDPTKTYLFSNHDQKSDPAYKRVADDLANLVKLSDIQAIFGLCKEKGNTVGQAMWSIYQTTAAFSKAYGDLFKRQNVRCLVAYAIDQDPYFRLARDNAERLGFYKPCGIMCRFLPSIEGEGKMSTTATTGMPKVTFAESKTVFMDSTPKQIKKLINKHGFSGGQQTLELHRELGGRADVDIAFQWLRHFLEDDDELEELRQSYESGELLSGQMKGRCIEVVTAIVTDHQARVAEVTDEIVESFYDRTNIEFLL